MNQKPRVLVPLGTGFEELEAIAAIDLLRRAGCQVVTCSVGAANPIVGRNRLRVMADLDLSEALAEWGDDWDLVLLPGGLGEALLHAVNEGLGVLHVELGLLLPVLLPLRLARAFLGSVLRCFSHLASTL